MSICECSLRSYQILTILVSIDIYFIKIIRFRGFEASLLVTTNFVTACFLPTADTL